jgi:hypothetical protein
MAVELAANAGHHALAHRGHEIGLAKAPEALEEIGAEEGEGNELEHHEVALDEDLVHGRLHQPGDESLRARHQSARAVPVARMGQ